MKTLMLMLMLLASPILAADRYLIIGINKDATNHDKLALLSVINKFIDPDYSASMAITIYKISDPTTEAIIGCWDIGGRKFPFTKQQALNYFSAHAGDFNNVNMIRLLAADSFLEAITVAGWVIKI